MKRRHLLRALAVAPFVAAVPSLMAQPLPEVHVFKSPYCGCCVEWVEHMKRAGFTVKVTDVDDTTAARKRLGMPDRFGSCHTATVSGYVLEGHVPADDVKQMLAQKPLAVGLAVPGMPLGSPGMEMGSRKHAYRVFLIDKAGRGTVFADYPTTSGETQ